MRLLCLHSHFKEQHQKNENKTQLNKIEVKECRGPVHHFFPSFLLFLGTRGKNLEGKMFTLSQSSGGIVFFPPYLTAQPPTSSDYNYPTDTPSTTIAPAVTGEPFASQPREKGAKFLT